MAYSILDESFVSLILTFFILQKYNFIQINNKS